MNPSRQACEAALARHPAHILAMGTLASGFLRPREAYQYLASVPRIEAVVVGASSRERMQETFQEIIASGVGGAARCVYAGAPAEVVQAD